MDQCDLAGGLAGGRPVYDLANAGPRRLVGEELVQRRAETIGVL